MIGTPGSRWYWSPFRQLIRLQFIEADDGLTSLGEAGIVGMDQGQEEQCVPASPAHK